METVSEMLARERRKHERRERIISLLMAVAGIGFIMYVAVRTVIELSGG